MSSREEAMRARITSQYEKAQERLAQLVSCTHNELVVVS